MTESSDDGFVDLTEIGELSPSSERRTRIFPLGEGEPKEDELRREQRWEALIEHYLAALEKAEGKKEVSSLLKKIVGVFRDELHDDAQAFDGLVEALRADPSDAETLRALETLASTLGRQKELADALQPFDPYHPLVQAHLAVVHREKGDLAAQRAALELALARASDPEQRRDIEVSLGNVAEARGAKGLAKKHYTQALALDAGAYEALLGLERIHRAEGRFPDLVGVLEKQIDAAPDHATRIDVLLRIAAVHEHQFVKPQDAAAKFELALALDPTKKEVLEGLERCYRAARDWDALVATLDRRAQATAAGGARAKAYAHVGEVHEDKRGDIGGAIAAYLRAEREDPRSKRVLYELARLSEKQRDYTAAAAYRGRLAELTTDPAKRAEIHAAIGEMLSEGDREPLAARIHFERALALDPTRVNAWQALQRHAERSGDDARAAECLFKRAEYTESPRVKAQLLVELAQFRADALADARGAFAAYEGALAADATNEDAARAVLDAYVKAERWSEALPLCELLVHAATRDGDEDRAFELLGLGARCAVADGNPQRAVSAALAALELRPSSLLARERLIDLFGGALEGSAPPRARAVIEGLVADPGAISAGALARLAEIARRMGRRAEAIVLLERALTVESGNPDALGRLAVIHAEAGEWVRAAACKRSLAVSTQNLDDRFRLFVEAGEILAQRAGDLRGAARELDDARALRPGDAGVLHAQMAIYGELEEWHRLADTLRAIERTQDAPADRPRRAKTLFTMAQVAYEKIGDAAWASALFAEVLDVDATRLDAFEWIVRIQTELRDWPALEAAYRAMAKRLRGSEDIELKYAICHQLGLVYRDRLGDAPNALASFRAALLLKPDSAKDQQIIRELLVVAGDLDGALAFVMDRVRKDPEDRGALGELYELYLRGRRFDHAWCVVDLLGYDGGALADEQRRFHDSYPPASLAEVPGTLIPAAWDSHILHPDLDPLITRIFCSLLPAVVRVKTDPLGPGWLGPELDNATENGQRVGRAFLDASEVLGVTRPSLYPRGTRATPFVVAPSAAPSVLVSLDLTAGMPRQCLAYLAGKYIALSQPELLARALFPTVAELGALVQAAVRIAATLDGVDQVSGTAEAGLMAALTQEEARSLRQAVKLASSSGVKLDVKRWARHAEISAARAGLLLAGSIDAARRGRGCEAGGPGDLSPRDFWEEMVLFATSDTYAELRGAIGVGVPANT